MRDLNLRALCGEAVGEDDAAELLFCDGFDQCIVGVADGFGSAPRVVYDRDRLLGQLVTDGMTFDEAVEYFEFNIIGAFMGPYTPLFLTRIEA